MEELQKKYDTLVRKYNALLAENEELQSILLQHGIAYSASEISDKEPIFSPVIFPSVNFTPDEKIALFSSFFWEERMFLHEDGSAGQREREAINRSVPMNGEEESATRNDTSARIARIATLLL